MLNTGARIKVRATELNIPTWQLPRWLVSAWCCGNDSRHLFSVAMGCHRSKNSYCIRRYQPGTRLRTADEPTPTATTYTSLNFAPPTMQYSDPFLPLPASPQCHYPASLIHNPFYPFSVHCPISPHGLQHLSWPTCTALQGQPACKCTLFQVAPPQSSSRCLSLAGGGGCLLFRRSPEKV